MEKYWSVSASDSFGRAITALLVGSIASELPTNDDDLLISDESLSGLRYFVKLIDDL